MGSMLQMFRHLSVDEWVMAVGVDEIHVGGKMTIVMLLTPPAPEEEADTEPGLPSLQTPLDDPIS